MGWRKGNRVHASLWQAATRHTHVGWGARGASSSMPRAAVSSALAHTLWPAKRKARSWGLKFQTITQLSSEPEISCFKLVLNATHVTASLWPLKDLSSVGSSGCMSARVPPGVS